METAIQPFTENKQRLLQLIKDRAYQRGEVLLSSGAKSDFYIDGKKILFNSVAAHLIGEVICDELADVEFDAIGGPAVGALPMVSTVVVSCFHRGIEKEGFFVRPKAKEHGTKNVIEGVLNPGEMTVVVDDVVTSGKSVLKAIDAVEELGAHVKLVLSIVDRDGGAEELFRSRGLEYRSIFSKTDVVAE